MEYMQKTQCFLVREQTTYPYKAIKGPEDAADIVNSVYKMKDLSVEQFVIILVNAKSIATDIQVVSIGSNNSSIVDMRAVFAPAILAGAYGLVAVHNHPSGDATPSECDRQVTEKLVQSGKILGIEVLDHLIIGDTFYSFKEHGEIE